MIDNIAKDVADQIEDVFNESIARELLLEVNPLITEEIQLIYSKCDGNPYNAVPLYKIIQIMKNQ